MDASLERLAQALSDRYAIEREIGRGGMAVVYRAKDLRHERTVAIKVLSPRLATLVGAKRFLREIQLTARLRHPHILPLYDSGQAEGLLYYVMPFVEGEALRDRLSREKQLPVEEAVRIAREIADALGFAHAHDVIHRDIKPENILLERGHAVLTDFGVARAISVAGGDTLTRTGFTIGTPAYSSPEQAEGNRPLDGRSDLYSLGCVLFEMIAGHPPFMGVSAESVARQHRVSRPPPLKVLRPAVPDAVVTAVERALTKTPAERFPTGEEFAETLAGAMEGPVMGMPVPSRVELRSLGSADLLGPEGAEPQAVLTQPKRLALLTYLAVAQPHGFQRRDKLVGLFWPESDQEHARAALSTALSHLRRSLGEGVVVTRGTEEVGLDRERFWCDAVAFEDALDQRDFGRALELYRGDLLEGLFLSGCPEFEKWLDGKRGQLREGAAGAAWKRAQELLAKGLLRDAERMAQRALGLVPTEESEVRRFIEALADAGDRAAAVRFYNRFEHRLKEELDLRPSPRTRELAEEIRRTREGPAFEG